MDVNPYPSTFFWPPANPPPPPIPVSTTQMDSLSTCRTQPMFSQNLMEWPSNHPLPRAPLPTLNTRAPLVTLSKNGKDNINKTSFKRHNSAAITSACHPLTGGFTSSKLKRTNSNLAMPLQWQPDPRNLALRRLDTENKDLRETMVELRQAQENAATFIVSNVSNNTSNALDAASKKLVDENATNVAKIVQEAVNYCSQSCKSMVEQLERRVGAMEDCVATLKPLAEQTLEVASALKSQLTTMQDKTDERGSEVAERCEAMIQDCFDSISQHLATMKSDSEHSDQQLMQFFEQQLEKRVLQREVAPDSPLTQLAELDDTSYSSVSQSIMAERNNQADGEEEFDLEASIFNMNAIDAPATNVSRRKVLLEGFDLTVDYQIS